MWFSSCRISTRLASRVASRPLMRPSSCSRSPLMNTTAVSKLDSMRTRNAEKSSTRALCSLRVCRSRLSSRPAVVGRDAAPGTPQCVPIGAAAAAAVAFSVMASCAARTSASCSPRSERSRSDAARRRSSSRALADACSVASAVRDTTPATLRSKRSAACLQSPAPRRKPSTSPESCLTVRSTSPRRALSSCSIRATSLAPAAALPPPLPPSAVAALSAARCFSMLAPLSLCRARLDSRLFASLASSAASCRAVASAFVAPSSSSATRLASALAS
mmetsp:Transcript_21816/g.65243  ORF Transcript_21816/g.65243 Transcript_21816/m.65243 type:complete len:275 (-) Transcript_21816:228-1052(-)